MTSSSSPALVAQLPLIEALRTRLPGTDAHHPARVIETLISWVLLAGGFAYKIKKAVDLGFVDFTTLELRRHFCDEELRLNRRLAPDLYLDVLPIRKRGQTPLLENERSDPSFDSEPAVEYAVRMREFPQDALASHALQRGDLRAEHIDALAALIADFHRHIAIAPPGSEYGSPATVVATMLQNFDVIDPLTDDADERAEIAALRAWTEAGGKRGQPAFSKEGSDPFFQLVAQRQQQGFVRECHGDLHLGNMVLLHDRLVVFDCIEFNARLRWIDVISEIAFVVMDLVDRGAPQFAHRFLNAYVERSGDYAGLAVLPTYRCYRAMVRAKVARLRIAQMPAGAERDDELVEYRSYLDLAREFIEPPRPLLLITHGLSGSGKSTVTQGLLEAIGAVRLRTDVERKRMFAQSGQGETAESGIYTPDATRQTYARVADLARDVLHAGFVCIVDATFLKRWQRDQFRSLAEELNVPFTIISFTASEPTLRARVAARAAKASDISDADVAILEHQLRTQEPLAADELPGVVFWDAEATAPDDPQALAGLVARLR